MMHTSYKAAHRIMEVPAEHFGKGDMREYFDWLIGFWLYGISIAVDLFITRIDTVRLCKRTSCSY